jgi:DNA polymerase-3 subunit epsilon
MDFVALDVETANADMASICQIGIAHFADGHLANEWKSYVDPKDFFDWINISIHGITEETVAGAPTFLALADTVSRIVGEHIVVTHTAFDRVSLLQAAKKWQASPLPCTWLDSACVARRTWKQFAQRGYGIAECPRDYRLHI